MLRIGLTGGIGSGKSTVARVFESMGIPVYYADVAAREIINTDPDVRANVITHFGSNSYRGEVLNREYISSIVFQDKQKLELLNSLTHPATIRNADEWMQKQTAPYVVKEAALLFESGSAAALDIIVGVYAPQALRIKRVMERDGVTRDEVLKRINRQIEENIKMKLCDIVLVNDEQQLLLPQVVALDQQWRG